MNRGPSQGMYGAVDVRPVLYVVGTLVTVLGLAMFAPMVVDLAVGHPDWMVFGSSAALTVFFGVLLRLMNRTQMRSLTLRQAFLLTTLAWIFMAVFSALPFMFSQFQLDAVDALFEAMSGLTTTGSTVIAGLDRAPPGILLWRSLLQWIGGIGIVAMGLVILPFLRVGGMQLFRTESSDRSEKVLPRAGDLAFSVGWIYLSLTVACAVALALAGMSGFDAICHAMTAVSTGGFSTRDASIAAWNSATIEWILVLFMAAGALPFVRYINIVMGDAGAFWRDTQIQWFLGFVATVSVVLAIWLYQVQDLDLHEALRHATFNVVSVVTTTGYASADYGVWGALAVGLFFLLTPIGGCTGSTAGGLKIFRFEILFLVLKRQIVRLYSPHRVVPLTYAGKPVDDDVMLSVMGFGFVFISLVLVFAVVLTVFGLDLITALSGAATAVANVGPGLGPVIGPVGNFAPLPDGAKLVLTVAMLLGRLEFFTVLVLLSPNFWRQ